MFDFFIDKQMFPYYNQFRTNVSEQEFIQSKDTGDMGIMMMLYGQETALRDAEERMVRRSRRAERLRKERIHKAGLIAAATLSAVLMVVVCTLSFQSIRTNAGSGFKYYTSVTVESGETLWSLADRHIDYSYYKDKNSYISEVKSINHLDDSCFIKAGQILILPYYTNEYVK